MPELQRFIWEWQSLVDRIHSLNPVLGDRLARSSRPIAAERRPDGHLVLVLGNWVPADRNELRDPNTVKMLESSMKKMTEETITLIIENWPAGDGEPDAPPDPLDGLDDDLKERGRQAGSALKRAFFAAAAKRGMVFETKVPVRNYRIDFALPKERIGVEIGGWSWRRWARPDAAEGREREQNLGFEGWRILWFSGEEVLKKLDWTIGEVSRAASNRPGGRRSNGHVRRPSRY